MSIKGFSIQHSISLQRSSIFPYSRYLIRNIPINLTLYYLITISTPIINILITFTALISLSLYSFNNSFTSDLSDKRTEIDPFPEYDIFIVFTVWDTLSIRLISMFNSNIKSASDILSDLPYLINMNLFEVFVFFFFLFLPFFLSSIPFSISFSFIRVYILLLSIYSLLMP